MNLKISLGSLLVMNGGCLSFSNAYMISHEKMMRKIENLGGGGGGWGLERFLELLLGHFTPDDYF